MDYQHVTKDRSLGYTELHLNEIAAEADSEEYPHSSTGKKVEAANLKFGGGTFKGQLHYEAEFIPALALKNFEFSAGGNRIQHAVDGANGDAGSISNGDGGSVSSSDIEAEAVPAGITTRGPLGTKRKENHVKNVASTDTSFTVDTNQDANSIIESSGESEGKDRSGKGVVLSKEELMEHRKLGVLLEFLNSYRRYRIWNHCLQHYHCPADEEGSSRGSVGRCILARIHHFHGS